MWAFSWRAALLLTGCCMVGSAHASGGGSLGSPPPPPPPPLNEAGTAFDGLRKPPIPASFLSHDGGWIAFDYPPSARDRVAPLIAQADDVRGELAETLAQPPLDGVEVRVARGPEEMTTLAPTGAVVPVQVTGAAYPKIKLVVLSLGSASPTPPGELAGAFRREVARIALHEAVGALALPSWFVEGFTTQFAGDGSWVRSFALHTAALRRQLLPISDLVDVARENTPLVALAEASDFMRYLTRPDVHRQFGAALTLLREGRSCDEALASGYSMPLRRLESAWRDDLERRALMYGLGMVAAFPAVVALGWWGVRFAKRRRTRIARAGKRAESDKRSANERRRVHIVFSKRDDRHERLPVVPEAEIPKVEHDGEWHTLH